MPERVDAALRLRAQAERLRQVAKLHIELSPQLVQIAGALEDEARKLEAAAIRDLGKTA